jgi:hypothetical protein
MSSGRACAATHWSTDRDDRFQARRTAGPRWRRPLADDGDTADRRLARVVHFVVGEDFVEWPDGAEGLAEVEAVGATLHRCGDRDSDRHPSVRPARDAPTEQHVANRRRTVGEAPKLGACKTGPDMLIRAGLGVWHQRGTHTMHYEFTNGSPVTEQDALDQVAAMGWHGLAFDDVKEQDEILHWHEFESVAWVISGAGAFADEHGNVTQTGPGCRVQAPAGWLHRTLAGTQQRIVIGTNLPFEAWTRPINKEPAERPASLSASPS